MMQLKETKTEKGLIARKKIYDSAIELMNSKGYENTSINDICKNAGFAVGNFYHYFKSKIDILIEFIHLNNQELLDYCNQLECDTNIEKLRTLTVAALEKKDFLSKDFVAQIFIIELKSNNHLLQLNKHVYLEIVHELVENAQKNNEITKKLSATEISNLIINNVYGLISSWLYSEIRYSLKDATEKNLDIMLKLLKDDL